MTASAASTSILVLLALAGGFMFAVLCERTRYPSLRGEGQQLYFYAAVFAVVLIFISRVLITVAIWLLPAPVEKGTETFWARLAGPLDSPALLTFFLAFWLGPVSAAIFNRFSDSKQISAGVIEDFGGQLEKFLYDAVVDGQLIFVALGNRKVYIGWPMEVPKPKPRREEVKEHFRLLPVESGFLDEHTLEPEFTTPYAPVYNRIASGKITAVAIEDFQIVIPLDEVTVVRAYSLEIDQRLFDFPQEEPAAEPGRLRQLIRYFLSKD